MIRMIKGTYGLVKNGTVEPMTKHSPAFSINAAREAELVEAGVAVYEAEPESTFSEYNGMNMTELREAAAAYGVDASAVRSKKEVIALIEAAKAKADMVIMGKASDLPENLDPGRLLNLDGREVIVVTTTSEMGLVQIAVRQNRMS